MALNATEPPAHAELHADGKFAAQAREMATSDHERRSKRKERDESDSSSSDSSDSARRKRRRKEHKKEKKRKKEEKKRKKERRHRDSDKERATPLPSVYAGVSEPLPSVYAGVSEPLLSVYAGVSEPLLSVYAGVSEEAALPDDELQPKQRTLGAQRPEDAQVEYERSQRIFTVFDPSLGVERQVRASGEVVEQCVSRSAAAQLQHDKARVVQPVVTPGPQRETYTGRTKFPSQHPWFGYK